MSDKKKTTIIIICCVLAVALVAFLLWRLHKKDTEAKEDAEDNDPAFPLSNGSRGDEVLKLQKFLNRELTKLNNKDSEIKYTLLVEDGIFGANTETACNVVFGQEYVTKAMFDNYGI